MSSLIMALVVGLAGWADDRDVLPPSPHWGEGRGERKDGGIGIRTPDRAAPHPNPLPEGARGPKEDPRPRRTEDGPLSLADLPDYLAALSAPAGPAESVGFRDLWEHPDTYRDRRVRVEGEVARRFQQPPVGRFPALVEVWLLTPENNPYCLVYPAGQENGKVDNGVRVRFEGAFLKRVRYRGGDGDRLAPLIVGAGPPVEIAAKGPSDVSWPERIWLDGAVGLSAATLVLIVIGLGHLRRPPRRREPVGPPPSFVDGPAESGDGTLGSGGGRDGDQGA
jgi:hypothetical protein